MTAIIVQDNPVEVGREAAARIVQAARLTQQQQQPYFSLALAGGTTPRECYRALADCKEIDWQRVQLFWGDERAVPPDHPHSNFGLAKEALLDHVQIPERQIHRMRAEAKDLEAAAREYERELAESLGTPPRLDLVLLGIGEDAHTASLFPGMTAVQEQKRLVVPTDAPSLARRLTLTPVVLNAARQVLFLVTGRAKRSALRRIWQAPFDPIRTPAQVIQPSDGEVVWLLDCEAACTTEDARA